MREIIDRILEGNIEDEKAPLSFSVSKIELSMKRGEHPTGTFRIFSNDGKYTHGYVQTTDSRMVCLPKEFVGTDEEISFEFMGDHLEEGEVVKGDFCIISNHGEFYLPFVVTVVHTVLDSSMGEIKNLFHFANLARSAPKEAVDLFYSKDFGTVFQEADREYFSYYKGLCTNVGNAQNVEEFLICVHKKQKIDYIIKPGEICLDEDHLEDDYEISITKNGWGFTNLKVETTGDFLVIDKESVLDEDFSGNVCRILFSVHSEYLHRGNNFGEIRFITSFDTIRVPVKVCYHGVGNEGIYRKEKKQVISSLMELYQDFRMRKIGTNAWLRDSSKLTERLLAVDESDLRAKLFKAQLLITERRINEAKWILEHVQRELNQDMELDAVAQAYYLYLTSLVQNEEEYIDMVTEKVTALYHRNRDEWKIAWLLLYLNEDYSRSFSKKWMFIEEQFERGCISPVFYAEAILLLNANPSLLSKLGEYEKRLLAYGAKKGVLNAEVCMQMVYLVSREKTYTDGVFLTLTRCYKLHPENSILQEICSLLMKGNRYGKKYLPYYKKAVENELRITRLYEYYMMSLEEDAIPAYEAEALPKMLLMYFSYQNSLSTDQMAYLYANVHKYRQEYSGLYESFKGQMEQFVIKELLQRKVSANMKYLYQNVLDISMLNDKCAEAFMDLAFLHEMQLDTEDIRRVIVYEPGMKEEKIYPVSKKSAWLILPGSDYPIFLEDEKGNRYAKSVPYTLSRFLDVKDLLSYAMTVSEDSHEVNMHCCFIGRDLNEVTPENEKRFVSLYKDSGLIPFVRRKIGFKLLRFYYDQDKLLEMDELLSHLRPVGFSARERDDVLKYMVLRGMENYAYEWITEYGPFGMDAKTVVKICSKLLAHEEFMQEDGLVEAVYYAFSKGKYEEKGLRYLALHYEGMTKRMRDIWMAAKSYSVSADELTERMILQMLFTGVYVGERMEIFKAYVESGKGRDLVKAFVMQCAYGYYIKDKLTQDYIFELIAKDFKTKENIENICKLAFVKYYAENQDKMREDCPEILRCFIRDLLKEGIVLKMFKAFPNIHDSYINSLSDRTIIEYHASEGARVVMHYRLGREDGKEEVLYKTEEMKVSYGNIFFKEFILFFGESLQYYIVEIKDGEEQVTESVTLQVNETTDVEGKYSAINDLSISYTMGDYEAADKMLADFAYKDYLQRGLFAIK